MDTRHQFMCFPAFAFQGGDLVIIRFLESGVTFPAMRIDHAPRFDLTIDESVEAIPRRVRDALKPNSSARTVLLARDEADRSETGRILRVLEDRPGRHRHLMVACTPGRSPGPAKPVCRRNSGTGGIGPAKLDEVRTGGIGGELRFELKQVSWVVVHGPQRYPTGEPESIDTHLMSHHI
jgi:hypothetical protein